MLKKIMLVLILTMGFFSNTNAKITIKDCRTEATQQNIKKAIRFFSKNLEEIRGEEYSYVRQRINIELIINDIVPIYIADADRYEIGLTDDEVRQIRSVLSEQDVMIRCAKPLDFICKVRQVAAYASKGEDFFHRTFINGSSSNVITLCNGTHDISMDRGCNFSGIIAHELAHLADLPIHPKHNHTKKLLFADDVQINRFDKVYKLGHAITNLCNRETQNYQTTVIDGVEYFTSQ